MRTFDPSKFNEIANIPHVRRVLGGAGTLDYSAALANPNNYAFQNDQGGFICANIYGSSYEVHTFFDGRLADAREVNALMFQSEIYMFTRTNCQELVTRVPDGNRWAESLCNQFGFRDIGRQRVWMDGKGAAMKRKTLEDWVRGAPETHLAGRQFHETLEKAKAAAGSSLPAHADDNLHDAIVGGAILMSKGGQLLKGISFFNYWAVLTGYRPVQILSDNPPVVDVNDAIIGFENGKVEVYHAR